MKSEPQPFTLNREVFHIYFGFKVNMCVALLLLNSTGANIPLTVREITPPLPPDVFPPSDFVLSFHHCPPPTRSCQLGRGPCFPKQRGKREGVQVKEGVAKTIRNKGRNERIKEKK